MLSSKKLSLIHLQDQWYFVLEHFKASWSSSTILLYISYHSLYQYLGSSPPVYFLFPQTQQALLTSQHLCGSYSLCQKHSCESLHGWILLLFKIQLKVAPFRDALHNQTNSNWGTVWKSAKPGLFKNVQCCEREKLKLGLVYIKGD